MWAIIERADDAIISVRPFNKKSNAMKIMKIIARENGIINRDDIDMDDDKEIMRKIDKHNSISSSYLAELFDLKFED